MPKKLLQKWMPNPESLKSHKNLRFLQKWLLRPSLWHLNRHATARSFAVGLFVAWLPIPFQMVVAATFAIVMNANIPVAVLLVWITNPITMPIMFYYAYVFGCFLLGQPSTLEQLELNWDWFISSMDQIGLPFLVGCLALGCLSSLFGYLFIKGAWRWSVMMRLKRRKR
jgi:uncharacterized protein